MKEVKKTFHIHSGQLKSIGPRRIASGMILLFGSIVLYSICQIQYDLCLAILKDRLVLQKIFIFSFGDYQGRH